MSQDKRRWSRLLSRVAVIRGLLQGIKVVVTVAVLLMVVMVMLVIIVIVVLVVMVISVTGDLLQSILTVVLGASHWWYKGLRGILTNYC